MLLKGRNLVKSEDFSVEEIDQILSLSQNIIENPSKYSRVCEGKLLATLFYEPSTRTRLSFESAMCRLGGSVVGFSCINMDMLLEKELMSLVPVQILCRPDCKGLCKVCGANHNYEECSCDDSVPDPRLSVFANILKN